MYTMMRIVLPQLAQVLTSMPNTRLRRCGNVETKGKICPLCFQLDESQLDWTRISTGELLRAEREAEGPTAATIEEFIAAGKSVPNAITVTLLEAAMENVTRTTGKKTFLLDEFLTLSPI